MKIGLITMHNVCNFGAVLQTYSTTKILTDLGHECTIIDYVPPVRKGLRTYFPIERHLNPIRRYASWMKWLPTRIRWQRPFNEFMHNKYKLTKKYIGIESLMVDPPLFDAYITGSDQVWNPDSTDGFDKAYYLSFVPEGRRKISYAASISLDKFNQDEEATFVEYVHDFTAISVREKTAIDLLKSVNINTARLVLDPTMLLDKNDWNLIANESNINISGKYLLIYALGDVKDLVAHAVEIASRKNLKVIKLGWDLVRPNGVDKIISFAKTEDFIKLFMKADFIVTNSFHGTAFSINFNKDFVSKPSSLNNPRFMTVLGMFGLEKRCFLGDIYNTEMACTKIDYEDINKRLDTEREYSLDFIRNSLVD